MTFGKYLAAAAALAMTTAPAFAASANPAAKLSVAGSSRVGTAKAKKNSLAGGGIVVAIIAAAAVVAGIIIVADDDDSN